MTPQSEKAHRFDELLQARDELIVRQHKLTETFGSEPEKHIDTLAEIAYKLDLNQHELWRMACE